jgi:hypothetical protein
MASPPADFGKRKPTTPPAAPPVKRSGHVALLMMGTFAVGGGAYALMPRENCQPASPSAVAGPSPPLSGVTAPAAPTLVTTCGSHSSSGCHGSWWSHSNYYGGSSSPGSSTAAGSTATTRGGFGSFGHLFSGGG